MKRNFLYLITFILLSLSSYANTNQTKENIFTPEELLWLKNHPTLRLGIDNKWAPMEFVDKDGNYHGIAAEYFQRLEKILGVKFSFYIPKKSWAEVLVKIKNKEIDLISAIVPTKQRKEYILFSQSYMSFTLNILTRDEVNYIKDLDEIKDKKITVIKDYATNEYLKEKYPYIELLEVNNISEALEKIASKEAYAYVGLLPSISYYVKKLGYHHLKISGVLEQSHNLSIGIRDDYHILISILNKALNTISEEEQTQIYNKWIQLNYIRPQFEKYLLYSVVILLMLVFMAVYRSLINKKYAKILEAKNKELELLSNIDALTQVYNRRKIEELLSSELTKQSRLSYDISVIMIDIDFFKKVNDTYGHKIGDDVLIEFSRLIYKNIRRTDYFGRYGGEEFLIICPNTNTNGAKKLAKNLLTKIEKYSFTKKDLNITSSFGIAQLKRNEKEEELLKRADDALYYSKENGRNMIYAL